MTAPNPGAGGAVPAGAGPQPPGTFRLDPPKRPHLNVVRVLDALYSDPTTNRWTLIWYRDDFYLWDTTHWKIIPEGTVRAEVYELLERGVYVGNIPGSGNPPLQGWLDFDPDPAKMNNIMSNLKDKVLVDQGVDMPVWFHPDSNFPIKDAPFDAHEMISCQNGLLYTRTRTLYAHMPRYFNGYSVAYEYSPGCPPPQEWLNFLKSVWPDDPESIATLQEWFGYFLTQRNDQQMMLFLAGAKRGGKGTIIRILTALMGEENVTGTSIADLNQQGFGLEGLVGKQLAVMSDVRFRSRDDGTAVERLLKISGGDAVLINRKYKQPYTATLTTRFLMASNELPKMSDESGALKSRIMLLRFKESFLGREDRDLERRLRLELPGILNWALDGLERLNTRGQFVQPEAGKAELQTIEDLGAPTITFIRDCCIASPAGMTRREDMYEVYRMWCTDNGVPPKSKVAFGAAIRAAVPSADEVKRGPRGSQKWHWAGIELGDLGREYLAQVQTLNGLRDLGGLFGGDTGMGGAQS